MDTLYIIKSAMIIAVLWLVYKLLLKKDTYFQVKRGYFLLGILASFLLPFWHIYKVVKQNIVALPIFSQFEFTQQTETEKFVWLSTDNLVYVMAFVSSILFIKMFIDLYAVFKIIRSGNKISLEDFILVETHKKITPFSFGKYIVYNPENFTPDEWQMILQHEKVHVKQRHTVDVLLSNILVALQWYNLFAWLYRKVMNDNLEFIADQQAQKQVENPKNYQYLLLKTSINDPIPIMSTGIFKSNLKNRIIMLQKKQTRSIKMLKISILIPLLIIFLYGFNTVKVYENNVISNTTGIDKSFYIDKHTPEADLIRIIKTVNQAAKNEKIEILKKVYDNNILYFLKLKLANGDDESTLSFSGDGGIKKFGIMVKNGHIKFLNYNGSIISKSGTGLYVITPDKDKISGYLRYKGETYFYNKNKDIFTFYNKFGDEVDKKISVALLNKLLSELQSNLVTNLKIDNEKYLFYINGKQVSKKDVEVLQADKIKSINVLKGKTAVQKYGEKAKNGVIEFKLKEK